MHVVLASCAQVVGSFSEEAEAELNQAGQAVATNGYFVATRTATAPPGTLDTINELLVKLDAILDAAVNGAIDTAALLEVVKQAEDVAASLPGNAKCGLVKKPDTFHLAISVRIADLLDYVLFAADDFTTNELVEIMYMGVEVGAIGAGASDQAFSKKILDNLEQVLAARLEAAIANNDKAEMNDVLYAAITFAFKSLAQKAVGK